MEQQPGHVARRLAAASYGRGHRAATRIKEEAVDTLPEDQPAREEARHRSTLPDDSRGSTFRLPENRHAADPACGRPP